MLEKIIRYSFGLVGSITGLTLTRILFIHNNLDMSSVINIGIIVFISMFFGIILFAVAGKIIALTIDTVERVEYVLQNLTLYELLLSGVGLIAGLIVANLVTIAIHKIDIIGVPLSIMINILFGVMGVFLVLSKKNENLFEHMGLAGKELGYGKGEPKILDTSVIIDGRILDICRAGFLEGEIIIPDFVLEELRHLADSSDDIVRCKGRRGLDVLNIMNKDLNFPVRTEKVKKDEAAEVDEQLMNYAKEIKAKIITNDYNMNKVAMIKGIEILNINDLANAMKPIAVSGEELFVKIVKEGKENGQGVGYLDDGTMIVVDGGRKYKGEEVQVIVTSVLQTSAGRMIFAKLMTGKIAIVK